MTSLDTLWYSRSAHPSPLGLAAQLGWFLDEFRADGLRVFTVQDSSDEARRDAHLDHPLPHTIRQGGNVPAIWARSRGANTRLIGLSWMDEFQGILTLPDSGIESPADLAGRRLALPQHPAPVDSRRFEALHGFLVVLEEAGLARDAARFVDVSSERFWAGVPGLAPLQQGPAPLFGEYARVVGALLRREVDAVYVKGARGLLAARTAQAHVLVDLRNSHHPDARIHSGTPRPITVDAELLDEHPQIVERLLARIVAVGDWAERHAQETVAYLARETRTPEALVRQAYGTELHRHLHTELAEGALQALDRHQQFLLAQGVIAQPVDLASWVAPQVLTAARRRAQQHSLQVL